VVAEHEHLELFLQRQCPDQGRVPPQTGLESSPCEYPPAGGPSGGRRSVRAPGGPLLDATNVRAFPGRRASPRDARRVCDPRADGPENAPYDGRHRHQVGLGAVHEIEGVLDSARRWGRNRQLSTVTGSESTWRAAPRGVLAMRAPGARSIPVVSLLPRTDMRIGPPAASGERSTRSIFARTEHGTRTPCHPRPNVGA
jgi:hypothetical protein